MSSSETTDGLLCSEQEWVVVGFGCLKKNKHNKQKLFACFFMFCLLHAVCFLCLLWMPLHLFCCFVSALPLANAVICSNFEITAISKLSNSSAKLSKLAIAASNAIFCPLCKIHFSSNVQLRLLLWASRQNIFVLQSSLLFYSGHAHLLVPSKQLHSCNVA